MESEDYTERESGVTSKTNLQWKELMKWIFPGVECER